MSYDHTQFPANPPFQNPQLELSSGPPTIGRTFPLTYAGPLPRNPHFNVGPPLMNIPPAYAGTLPRNQHFNVGPPLMNIPPASAGPPSASGAIAQRPILLYNYPCHGKAPMAKLTQLYRDPSVAIAPPHDFLYKPPCQINATLAKLTQPYSHPDSSNVFIIFGKDPPLQAIFDLPRELVCRHSPLLEQFFSREKFLRTDDYTWAEVFEFVESWMETGQLGVDGARYTFYNCARIWLMAFKLGMVSLQNHVMRRMFHPDQERILNPLTINKIFSVTPAGSPLRRLVVDIGAFERDTAWLREPSGSGSALFHPGFLLDLALKLKHEREAQSMSFHGSRAIRRELDLQEYLMPEPPKPA